MKYRIWTVLTVVISVLAIGGLVISSAPELEVNVSAAVGYQGQAEVAVDPADPNRVVIVGNDDTGAGPRAWSSADGGNTFMSSELPLTFDGHPFAEGSEPTVTVDDNGILYAAYEVHDLHDGNHPIDSSLMVARSYDGMVWEAASLIEDNRFAGADPSVETPHIVSGSDRLLIVWVRKTGDDRAIYYNDSTDQAAAWTGSIKINDGASGMEDVLRPQVAAGPDGMVYAAWLDDLQKTIVVDVSTNSGADWTEDSNVADRVTGYSSSAPALAVDQSWTSTRGAVYVGFADVIVPADGLDVLVTSSSDNGSTWSIPVQVHSITPRQQYGPALAVHPADGSVHAAWYDRRADDVIPDKETETWQAVSTDGGKTWTEESAISSSPSDTTGDPRGIGANLSIAASGDKVYTVWTDNRTSDNEIYLAGTVIDIGTLEPGEPDTDTRIDSRKPDRITTSGHLREDETWFGVIRLTGDVTVPDNITLTIEAGTVIRVSRGDEQNSGVAPYQIELIIDGTLNLLSTPTSPVTFTSDEIDPRAGYWYGIRLTDSSNSTFPFHDAIVEYGMRGIWGYPGSHQDVVDCTVRDMLIDGIYLQYGDGQRDGDDPGLLVSGNDVRRTGTDDSGIWVEQYGNDPSWVDAVVIIEGNSTDDTDLYGISIFSYDQSRTEVLNNHIANADYGISVSCGSSSATYMNRCEIYDNQVTNASIRGINVSSSRSLLVKGNTVSEGGDGLHVSGSDEIRIDNNDLSGGTADGITVTGNGVTDLAFHRNTVTGYEGDGIVLSNLSSAVALYNTIDGSGSDAFRPWSEEVDSSLRLHWNNMQGNAGYDVHMGTESWCDMRHNYWAEANGEMLAEGYPSEISKIWDIEDDSSRGRVDYRGWELAALDTGVTLESRFIWPFDGDTVKNQTITLEGTAYAESGVQRVEVSTDGGSTWLPATGGELWTFPFIPVEDGLQNFLCRVTDNDNNVEITSDSITVTFDSSLPTTEGVMTGDETWSGPEPIVLTGDVIVPEGVTLTIEPGTEIRMLTTDLSNSGVDSSRIELIVEGALDLQGTDLSPILFTSDSSDPSFGDWYGIRLTDTADNTFTVHDLVVEFAVRGIWGTDQDVVDCIVRNSAGTGIRLEYGTRARDILDPGFLVSGNTVEYTDPTSYPIDSRSGIIVSRSGSDASWNDALLIIEGNTIRSTVESGIYVYLDDGREERVEVFNNSVTYSSSGISVVGNEYNSRFEIYNNQVANAGSKGISASWTRSVLIKGNTITESGSLGSIKAYKVDEIRIIDNDLSEGKGPCCLVAYSGNVAFHRNTVTGCVSSGFHVDGDVDSVVALYNTIDGAQNAFSAAYYTETGNMLRLHWNNLQGSADYDARLLAEDSCDMRRNYWAEAMDEMLVEGYPSEISKIWDIEDDSSLGRVDYRGWEIAVLDTDVTLESRFIWPFDGDTVNNQTITLEGTAYAEGGVQRVEVSTDGGSTWLPATGDELWTFPFIPVEDGLQNFLCRVTDNDNNVEITSDSITVHFTTELSGDQPTIYFHENGDVYEIHWTPIDNLTYDLTRGDLANLAVVVDIVDLGAVTCEATADGSGVIPDMSPDPATAQTWFYLLRDHVTPGNYGLDSTGRERVPASGDCP